MSIVVFQHSADTGPGRLGDILVEYGHRLRIVDLTERPGTGDASDNGRPAEHQPPSMPVDLDDVDALVSLGGRPRLREVADHPWMRAEMDLLRAGHERELPVIGIGLGAQLVAAALGGTVKPLGDGRPEIGWTDVRLSFPGTTDPVFAGIPWTTRQFVWHADEIADLPPGATNLASSDLCRHHAFRTGIRTYAFQYHPEIDQATVERWTARFAEDRQRGGVSSQRLLAETVKHYDEFDRLARRLCRSIADYVIPAVQRTMI